MLTTQKTICVIRHDSNTLPILEYMDHAQFVALSINYGVILWVYRGMSMLIPAARIANMAEVMEAYDKLESLTTKPLKSVFTIADAIILPEKIADALLGGDK